MQAKVTRAKGPSPGPQRGPNLRGEALLGALSSAQKISDAKKRAYALVELAPLLPETQRRSALKEALAAIAAIEASGERVAAVGELAPFLADSDREAILQQATVTAASLSNPNSRARAIARLLPALSDADRHAARRIAMDTAAAHPLDFNYEAYAGLAPYLPDVERDALMGFALAAIKKDSPYVQVLAFKRLSPFVTADTRALVLREIVRIQEDIVDPYFRLKSLEELASLLPEMLFPQALAVARTFTTDWDRGKALAALAAYLPDTLIPIAFADAISISQPEGRAEALISLIKRLPDQSRDVVLPNLISTVELVADLADRTNFYMTLSTRVDEDTREKLLRLALSHFRDLTGIGIALVRDIAPLLPKTLIPDAASEIRRHPQNDARVFGLSALAIRMPKEDRDGLLQEVLSEIRSISDHYDRAWHFVDIVWRWPESELGEIRSDALAEISALPDEVQKAQMLATMAQSLPDDLLDQAFVIANAIASDSARTMVLTELVHRLSIASGRIIPFDRSFKTNTKSSVGINYRHLVGLRSYDTRSAGAREEQSLQIGQQNEETLRNALHNTDQLLNDWLAAKGVAEDARPAFVAKIIQIVCPISRPLWDDRASYPHLKHLNAPRFLKAVYPDAIDENGQLSNEEIVRLADRKLVQMVQGYINKRIERKIGLGDADGLVFTQKDGRGRPKKPKAQKRFGAARSPR